MCGYVTNLIWLDLSQLPEILGIILKFKFFFEYVNHSCDLTVNTLKQSMVLNLK